MDARVLITVLSK